MLLTHSHLEWTILAINLTIIVKASFEKIAEGEMLVRTQSTTLFQIFCKIILYFLVIFKSMKELDNIFSKEIWVWMG